METPGRLITLEGIDGAGKTTLGDGLLASRPELIGLREPGGVAVAERIRELVKDPSLTIDPHAEALLFAASRAQLISERLRPLLDGGTDVLLDRYIDSSLAYQGAGRRLGVDQIAALNRFASGGLTPDLTLYVRVPPETGAARRSGADRLEQAGMRFYAAIVAAYDEIAAAEPARVKVLDGTQLPEQVLSDALRIMDQLIQRG